MRVMKVLPFLPSMLREPCLRRTWLSSALLRATALELIVLAGHVLLYPAGITDERRDPAPPPEPPSRRPPHLPVPLPFPSRVPTGRPSSCSTGSSTTAPSSSCCAAPSPGTAGTIWSPSTTRR